MVKNRNASSDWLSKLDIFGPPITLNFRGDSTFQSCKGGLLSIMIYIFTLVQALFLLQQLVLQNDPKIINYKVTDTKGAEKTLSLTENKQIIAFTLYKQSQGGHYGLNLDPKAGQIHIFLTTVLNYDYYNPIREEIQLGECDINDP